jgi:radical SAM-linked protein
MHFNINIGIFVPKPHTPYQWAAQIDSNTAFDKMSFIKNRLKSQGHKVGVSDPLISRIEGLIGRGDERAGDLIEQAFRRGSRLDAWSEYINKETWREILEKNRGIVDDILSEKNTSLPLPWEGVNSGVSIKYLRNELKKSRSHETTLPCIKKCTKLCGICGQDKGIVENSIQLEVNDLLDNFPVKSIPDTGKTKITTEFRSDPAIWRILFSFSKQNTAVFQSHLGLLEIFSMAINRAELPVMYTKGFNPLIKLEIASPLSIGISAAAEIAALDFEDKISPDFFIELLNKNLVEGMSIDRAKIFYIPGGHKKHSLASLLWGFCYQEENGVEFVSTAEEKHFRDKKEASPFFLKRKSVLAKNIVDKTANEWADYFDVYGYLYPSA